MIPFFKKSKKIIKKTIEFIFYYILFGWLIIEIRNYINYENLELLLKQKKKFFQDKEREFNQAITSKINNGDNAEINSIHSSTQETQKFTIWLNYSHKLNSSYFFEGNENELKMKAECTIGSQRYKLKQTF